MTHQQVAFRRKIVYLALMAGLLLPLSLLGLPRTGALRQGEAIGTVPVLATMREKDGLTQSSLGEINAGSETLKFATLGFRGWAATILWNQAHEHKKKQRWTALRDTLDQIGRLQPNFVNVWRYQGWNLAYNVSAEWDDYRQRYHWVLEGIAYLNKGQDYNKNQTKLIWDEGWHTGHKIGRSDEYRQFRRLFRNREWFAENDNVRDVGYRPPEQYRSVISPDNWLCSKQVFLRAIDLKDSRNVPLHGMPEEIYRSEPAKCQMRYAIAIIEEGTFGDVAKYHWKLAGDEWEELGNRKFLLLNGVEATLNDEDVVLAEVTELTKQLDALSGVDSGGKKVTGASVRSQLREERRDEWRKKLDAKARAILDKPAKDRTPEEQKQATFAEGTLAVPHADVAIRLPDTVRDQASSLVRQINEKLGLAAAIESKRRTLNYAFWRIRCTASGSEDGVAAEEMLYEARQAYRRDSASRETIRLYDKAFKKWRVVLDRYPELVEDGNVGDVMVEEIRAYRKALDSFKEPFDKNKFILKDVMEARASEFPN
jgi:hypothetical protein